MNPDKLLALVIVAILSVSMCFMFVNVAKADIIFTDGFGSGDFSNWTSTVGSPSITTDVTNPVNGGTYSADFPLSNASCYATATIPPTTTLSARANNNSIYYRITDSDGAYQWQFGAGNGQVTSSTPTIQLGQWYKIQLLAMTGSNSTFYFLVNDQLMATITNQTFGAIDELLIGHDWIDGYLGGDNYVSDVVATDITTPIIIASAGTGGSISPSGAVSATYGSDQSFTITPDTGFYIVDVSVNGSSVGPVNTYAFTNVQADHTISATFAPDPTPTPSPTPVPTASPTPTPTATTLPPYNPTPTPISSSKPKTTPTQSPTATPTSSSPTSPPSPSPQTTNGTPIFPLLIIVTGAAAAAIAALMLYKKKIV